MKSIKPAARKHGRISRILLLSFLCLTSWCLQAAHADGVSGKIANGQPVNGTLSGSGFDTYTFKVTAGSSFVLSVSETGVHDETFIPGITLTAPGGGVWGGGRSLFTIRKEQNAAEGTWSVKVDRHDHGTTGGSYALTLIQFPGAIAPVALSAGAANSGTNTRGKVDVWTFNGVAGQTKTLTLNQTGGAGFVPEIAVVSPTGGFVGGTSCGASCTQDVSIGANGAYTVLAWKNDENDVTGTYTISVNDKN